MRNLGQATSGPQTNPQTGFRRRRSMSMNKNKKTERWNEIKGEASDGIQANPRQPQARRERCTSGGKNPKGTLNVNARRSVKRANDSHVYHAEWAHCKNGDKKETKFKEILHEIFEPTGARNKHVKKWRGTTKKSAQTAGRRGEN